MRKTALVAMLALTVGACASLRSNNDKPAIRVGPRAGSLVVVGGGNVGPEIISRFLELAGGAANARVVIIPTAGEDSVYPANWVGARMFTNAGVRNVTVLHTRDRKIADTDSFTRAIKSATAVWIPGGRQWRLVDSYLGTRTLKELNNVLARGGVIGGTSAGASIQASYMVRGARSGNTIMMAPGYEQGFGFLRNTAVDQHLSQRNRQNDMLPVVERHPHLLGIGLDESTAIVVRGDTAEVVGRGRVAVYTAGRPFFWLAPGSRFDLNRRAAIE